MLYSLIYIFRSGKEDGNRYKSTIQRHAGSRVGAKTFEDERELIETLRNYIKTQEHDPDLDRVIKHILSMVNENGFAYHDRDLTDEQARSFGWETE